MSHDWTRRDFLRTSAALSAALAGAQVVLGQEAKKEEPKKPAKPRPTPPASNPKFKALKIGIVGAGGKGGHNLRLIAECGATIAALCDVDKRHMDSAAKSYPDAKQYVDFRKMLETEKDLDGVCVSTPDHTHAPAAMMAMKLGKPVYCEKPLTHTIAEARMMMETARQAKVATQMGNQGHSSEGSAQQVAWIKSGVIGPIKEVHIWTDRPIWPQGIERPSDTPPKPDSLDWDLWLGPAPERPYHPCYHPFNWRGWWDFGTGALGDMACHVMDAPYWALGLTNPTAVEAFSDGMTKETAPKWSVIRYEFGATSDRPALKLFWYDGRLLPTDRLVDQKKIPGDNGIIYVGEKGTIAAPLNSEPYIVQEKLAKEFTGPAKPEGRPGGYDRWHHEQWLAAILDSSAPKPTSNFDYAAPLTEVVLLGNLAIRTGRRIEWDAAKMTCTNYPDANALVKGEYRKGWEI